MKRLNDSELQFMSGDRRQTTCCIVGGGPAGMMLGYLLARQNVAVTVLEKHKDFNRDFRGDTVHPSTLELIAELDLLDDFLKVPHQELETIGGRFGDFEFQGPNFRHLSTRCKFVALMPQWDFLNFLAEKAQKFSTFRLLLEHEAVDLSVEGNRVSGVKIKSAEGTNEIFADLVVACDGRHSRMRQAAHLEVHEFGVPIDVLWFRLGRQPDDPEAMLGNVNYGRGLILINRGDYFQAGLIIEKGSFEEIKRTGLPAFQEEIRRIAPYLEERPKEIKNWEQVKLLSVQINRLETWHRPGLLCIGDAAHAMSPVGGVGINLAIQDAVATANLLTRNLQERRTTDSLLALVQRRREFPTRVTQALQLSAHRAFARIFRNRGEFKAPWQMRVVTRLPGVPRLLAHLVGVGVLPEHIQSPRSEAETKTRFLIKAAVCVGVAAAAVTLAFTYSKRKAL